MGGYLDNFCRDGVVKKHAAIGEPKLGAFLDEEALVDELVDRGFCFWGEGSEVGAGGEAKADGEELFEVGGVGELFGEVDGRGSLLKAAGVAVDVGDVAEAGSFPVAEG